MIGRAALFKQTRRSLLFITLQTFTMNTFDKTLATLVENALYASNVNVSNQEYLLCKTTIPVIWNNRLKDDTVYVARRNEFGQFAFDYRFCCRLNFYLHSFVKCLCAPTMTKCQCTGHADPLIIHYQSISAQLEHIAVSFSQNSSLQVVAPCSIFKCVDSKKIVDALMAFNATVAVFPIFTIYKFAHEQDKKYDTLSAPSVGFVPSRQVATASRELFIVEIAKQLALSRYGFFPMENDWLLVLSSRNHIWLVQKLASKFDFSVAFSSWVSDNFYIFGYQRPSTTVRILFCIFG